MALGLVLDIVCPEGAYNLLGRENIYTEEWAQKIGEWTKVSLEFVKQRRDSHLIWDECNHGWEAKSYHLVEKREDLPSS